MKQSTANSNMLTPDIARKIRLFRERQKMSQQALAEACGLSRNTLSLLERGQTSPTLVTLQKIADGLHVGINAFFQEDPRPGIVHQRERTRVSDLALKPPSGQGTYSIDGLVSALILRLEPKAECGSLLPHSGEEFFYCLSGRCQLTVDQQSYMLEPGDSLRFDGRLPNTCQNPGQEPTKALVIFFDIA